ncbi:ATP-dependent Clp protease adaptor ClpS, partial [bacterium]|nr:ATP-dependent Clp protease adaptor ClpS [bacterium]
MSTETTVDEKIVVALQPPKLWKVIFLNDDQTPMELVIDLLTNI